MLSSVRAILRSEFRNTDVGIVNKVPAKEKQMRKPMMYNWSKSLFATRAMRKTELKKVGS